MQKRIIITNTGQWRYSNEAMESLEKKILEPISKNGYEIHLIAKYWKIELIEDRIREVEKYLSIARKYCKTINIEWVDEEITNENNPFELIEHMDKLAYYKVFKMLSLINIDIEKKYEDKDIILRTRSDLIYLNSIEIIEKNLDKYIYIPPIEGHEEIPYDPRYVCNDQVALGTVKKMKLYLTLADLDKIKIQKFEKFNIEKSNNKHGIEGILREYLKSNKINIKNLNLLYYINGKKEQKFKKFISKYIPNKVIIINESKIKRLIFRIMKKIYYKLIIV